MTIGPLASRIVVRHIADDVVDRLVTAVALGVYVPSQQLPTERELASMLGVSRTSVREALKQLTDTGYFEVRRGRNGGYFVLADWGPTSAEHVRRHLVPNWDEFEKLFDARTLIEPLIARTAAERCLPSDAEAITGALRAYLEAADHDASRRADSSLHRSIAEATHNPILVELSVDLRTRVSLNLGAEPYSDSAPPKRTFLSFGTASDSIRTSFSSMSIGLRHSSGATSAPTSSATLRSLSCSA